MMKRFASSATIVVMVALSLCSAGFTAFEEEEMLFADIPVVITSTLTQKTHNKAPAAVTVITGKEIRESGARDLSELLNRINGITVTLISHARTPTSLRGIGTEMNDKFKLLINGHAFYEPIWNSYDFYDTGLENIKQIEIVRGPGSALYGTGAFAGIINIIMHTPEEMRGAKAALKAGSFNTWEGDLSCGMNSDETSCGIDVNGFITNGNNAVLERDQMFGTPFAVAPGEMKQNKQRKQARLCYESGGLGVTAEISQSMRMYPFTEMGALTHDGEKHDFDFGYAEAIFDTALSRSMTMKTKASYDYTHLSVNGELLPDGFSWGADINGDGIVDTWPDGVYFDYGYSSDQFRFENLLDYKITDNNELLLGVFYEHIRSRDVYVKTEMNIVYLYKLPGMIDISDTFNWNQPAQRAIYGAFFQDEWNITESWYLITGGRSEHYSDMGTTFNPRCGVVWEYGRDDSVKLLYGSAFRAPSFAELYHKSNPVLVGNPDLKPETIESVELNFNHTLAKQLSSEISVYALRADNLIASSVDRDLSKAWRPRYFVNYNRTKNFGVEITEKYMFAYNTSIMAGYSFTEAKDDITDQELAFVPRHQAVFGVNVPFLKAFNANMNMVYKGELPRESSDMRSALPATLSVDTTLKYDWSKKCSLFASVYNIFDEKVYSYTVKAQAPAADIPMPGATFSAGVTYKF